MHLELKSNKVIRDVVESKEYQVLKNFGGQKGLEMVKDVIKREDKPHGSYEEKEEGSEEHFQRRKEAYTKLKSNEVVKDTVESEKCKVLKIFGDEERSKIDRD